MVFFVKRQMKEESAAMGGLGRKEKIVASDQTNEAGWTTSLLLGSVCDTVETSCLLDMVLAAGLRLKLEYDVVAHYYL